VSTRSGYIVSQPLVRSSKGLYDPSGPVIRETFMPLVFSQRHLFCFAEWICYKSHGDLFRIKIV